MIPLPRLVADLCAALGDQRGVVAVALGGSGAALHDRFTRIPAAPVPLAEWLGGLAAALTAA